MAGAARDSSAVVRGWERLAARLRAAISNARVSRVAAVARRYERRLRHRLIHDVRESQLYDAAAFVRASVVSSYLYRWLTAEPDPTVIVIDLRETYSVGWLVALLERAGRRFGPPLRTAANHSILVDIRASVRARPLHVLGIVVLVGTLANLGVAVASGSVGGRGLAIHGALVLGGLLGLRSNASWDELRESRPGTWVAALVTPPDPNERREADRARTSSSESETESADGSVTRRD